MQSRDDNPFITSLSLFATCLQHIVENSGSELFWQCKQCAKYGKTHVWSLGFQVSCARPQGGHTFGSSVYRLDHCTFSVPLVRAQPAASTSILSYICGVCNMCINHAICCAERCVATAFGRSGWHNFFLAIKLICDTEKIK
eukprot:586409-Amphidinium_carterae.1